MEPDISTKSIIQGGCALFVCRCCRTKYGWAHQAWCDTPGLIEPGCADCRYYNAHRKRCDHPAKGKGRRNAV